MRAAVVIASIAALVAASAEAKLVSAGSGQSWGKAGVSLEQYRADAIACGHEAAAVDLRGTNPAKALVAASRLIDSDTTQTGAPMPDPTAGPSAAVHVMAMAGSTAMAERMIDPERQIAKAGDIMESALERCLTKLGYTRFKLTKAQQKRLSKLQRGSHARHAYLHSLASDGSVLTRQRSD